MIEEIEGPDLPPSYVYTVHRGVGWSAFGFFGPSCRPGEWVCGRGWEDINRTAGEAWAAYFRDQQTEPQSRGD